MRIKEGETLQVGSSFFYVAEIKGGQVKVAVKAPRSVPIRRLKTL